MKKTIDERMSPYIGGSIDESEEWDREKSRAERMVRQQQLSEVEKIKQEIVEIRRSEIEYGLAGIQERISTLAEQKKNILAGKITKAEILTRARAIVKKHRDRAIERFLVMPIATAKDNNQMPFARDLTLIAEFPERHTWDLFFLSLHDEDLKRVVDGLPDEGLSLEERKAEVVRINDEIKNLTSHLQEQMDNAKKDLKERTMKKGKIAEGI